MTHMEQSAIILENASKDTMQRWKETPGQERNAEENVKWALVYALNQDFYQGFTKRNNEREQVMNIGKDGIRFALLYNMLQLSSYRRQRSGESLGNADSFILLTTECCVRNEINELDELLTTGISEMMKEKVAKQQNRGVVNRDSSAEVAYEFANSVLDCYIYYNNSYGFVSATNPISTPYENQAAEKLDIYCRTEQVKKEQHSNFHN